MTYTQQETTGKTAEDGQARSIATTETIIAWSGLVPSLRGRVGEGVCRVVRVVCLASLHLLGIDLLLLRNHRLTPTEVVLVSLLLALRTLCLLLRTLLLRAASDLILNAFT